MNDERVLDVLHVASGDLWAGAEVQLLTLARALSARPDESVSVIVLNHGRLEQELRNSGINVIVLDESELNGFRILYRLVHIIRQLKPDIVHTHRLKENILGSIAALSRRDTMSMRTVHGAPEHPPAWWKLPKLMLVLLDRCCGKYLQSKIVVVSEDLAEYMESFYSSKQIHVIENGIQITAQSSEHTPPQKVESTFKVGMAGRLAPVKRADLFIQTAKHFIDEHPDIQISFHIHGDGPLRRQLENLNMATGINEYVVFEGHSDNFQEELRKLDILLLTSDHEGLPMVLLEAMSLQVPIIAHATGGIPKLLDDGNCGILVYKQEAAAYAHEIYKLLNNPGYRRRLAQYALQNVLDHYTDTQNATAYHNLYSEILTT